MTDDDFETCGLWPIRVQLDAGRGYTLWGAGGGDTDLLLAVDGRLRAFARWPQLVEFVLDGGACNLSALEGYGKLRAVMQQPGNRVPETMPEYPLSPIASWLRREASAWTADMRAAALNGLNLLWDAAATLGDDELRARLRSDQAPLGGLMDALTFADADAARAALAAAIDAGASVEYDRVLAAVAERWEVVGG